MLWELKRYAFLQTSVFMILPHRANSSMSDWWPLLSNSAFASRVCRVPNIVYIIPSLSDRLHKIDKGRLLEHSWAELPTYKLKSLGHDLNFCVSSILPLHKTELRCHLYTLQKFQGKLRLVKFSHFPPLALLGTQIWHSSSSSEVCWQSKQISTNRNFTACIHMVKFFSKNMVAESNLMTGKDSTANPSYTQKLSGGHHLPQTHSVLRITLPLYQQTIMGQCLCSGFTVY